MAATQRCQKCGQVAPTRSIVLYQNVGLLVVRFSRTAQGELCLPCIHQTFWTYTAVTSVAGWWGLISLCLTPLFLLNNVGRYVHCLATNGPYKRRAREAKAQDEAAERALLERSRAGDLAAGLELAATQLGTGRFAAARTHLEALVAATPDAAEAHYLLGIARANETRPEDATAHYARAAELAPAEVRYRETLAFNLERTGDAAGAEPLLRALLAEKPAHPPCLYALARALGALERRDEGLKLIEQVFAIAPKARQEVAVQKTYLELKRGTPLSPPPKAVVVDPEAVRRRGRRQMWLGVAFLGTLGLCAGVGAFAVGYLVKVEVWNPSSAPLKVRFDGERWLTVPAHGHESTSISRGAHVLESIGASGSSETTTVTVDVPYHESIFGGALYVCDPMRQGVFCDYDVTYGDATATREPVYHAAEEWFLVPLTDYVFTDPPTSVPLPQGERGTTKRVLKLLPDVKPIQVVSLLLSKQRPADALRYTKAAIERSPDDPRLFQTLFVAARPDEHEAVEKWIEERRTLDPASINFHRMYQEIGRGEGNVQGLEHEYARLRQANPTSAFASYLYGRVAQSEAAALEAYDNATALDPAFPWAHAAAGRLLVVLGREAEGLARYRRFHELHRGEVDRSREDYWSALFQARAWNDVMTDTDAVERTFPEEDELAAEVQGQSLVAREVDEHTWQLWTIARRTKLGDRPWFRALECDRLRATGDRAAAERALGDLEAKSQADHSWARVTRAGIALSDGDRATAEKLLSEEFAAKTPSSHGVLEAALLGIACEWAGDSKRAAQWYNRAAEFATNFDDHELSRFLLGRINARTLASGDRHRSMEARAVSVLARALRTSDDEERAALLDLALRCGAWHLSEPWFLIRGVLAKTKPLR